MLTIASYWENYLWLKDQPGFERDKFILSKRISLYKVAISFHLSPPPLFSRLHLPVPFSLSPTLLQTILNTLFFDTTNIYIGSIAGNPLNLGEQNPENFSIAGEAYDEAICIFSLLLLLLLFFSPLPPLPLPSSLSSFSPFPLLLTSDCH